MSNAPLRLRVRTQATASVLPFLVDSITLMSPDDVLIGSASARRHPGKQIKTIAGSLVEYGFMIPLVISAKGELVSGHARLAAAKLLGLKQVPTTCAAHLSDKQLVAYALAENRLAEMSDWDNDVLRANLTLLMADGGDLSKMHIGLEMGHVDLILGSGEDQAASDGDDAEVAQPQGNPVTRLGDKWVSVDRRLTIVCGDSRSEETYERLLGLEKVALIATDPPWNVAINKVVSRTRKHREFHEATGEMSASMFRQFLVDNCHFFARYSKDGALVFIFMDWRHIEDLIAVGREVFRTFINLCVWRKTTGGMGGLYRSAHELCAVFKNGDAPHINNVMLGRHGRNRSNVWTHEGANTFRKGRKADLAAHPTVKPVRMIMDIILDASNPNDLVLDSFLGSGTTLLAAHRTGRRGAGIDIDPTFVDVAISRIQAATGVSFSLSDTGEIFGDVAARRSMEEPQ